MGAGEENTGFSFLAFFKNLQWNSCNRELTTCKCAIQWHMLCSQCCATTTSVSSQSILTTPKGDPTPISSLLPSLSSPGLWPPLFCFLPLQIYLFRLFQILGWTKKKKIHLVFFHTILRKNPSKLFGHPTNGILHCVTFGFWLLSCNMMFSRFTHVVADISTSFLCV